MLKVVLAPHCPAFPYFIYMDKVNDRDTLGQRLGPINKTKQNLNEPMKAKFRESLSNEADQDDHFKMPTARTKKEPIQKKKDTR